MRSENGHSKTNNLMSCYRVALTIFVSETYEEEEAHEEAIGAYMQAVMEGNEAKLDDEVASYTFAGSVRDISIWAYKSSEFIGEEVLAYAPIPGEYIACGDVNELTQGKAWSL